MYVSVRPRSSRATNHSPHGHKSFPSAVIASPRTNGLRWVRQCLSHRIASPLRMRPRARAAAARGGVPTSWANSGYSARTSISSGTAGAASIEPSASMAAQTISGSCDCRRLVSRGTSSSVPTAASVRIEVFCVPGASDDRPALAMGRFWENELRMCFRLTRHLKAPVGCGGRCTRRREFAHARVPLGFGASDLGEDFKYVTTGISRGRRILKYPLECVDAPSPHVDKGSFRFSTDPLVFVR